MIQRFAERVRIVLVRPLQAGNVGASARAMKNMGLKRLVVVASRAERPERAWWMAPGAHDVLEGAQQVETLEEAIDGCTLVIGTTARGRKMRWPVLLPGPTAERVLDHDGEVAILFGPEDSGLDNESMAFCHLLATVPTDEAHSLNLAQAVLLICHYLFEEARRRGYSPPIRQRHSRRGNRSHPAAPANSGGPREMPATVLEMDRVARQSIELLERSAYLAGRSPDQVRLTLYHLLQRAAPTRREAEIMMGMLAKVTWTLDHPATPSTDEAD